MTKQEKVDLVNAAIGRSELAMNKGAQAEIDKDGAIFYSTRYPRHPESKRKETFRSILSLLHGQDARTIIARVNARERT